MFYVPQTSTNDCGFACLKMLLATINNDRGYLFLKGKDKTQPYSYKELIDIASTNSVELVGFKVEDKDEILNCTEFPIIVSFNPQNNIKHAVLVTKVKGKRIYFNDPSKGARSLSLSKFKVLWDGTGLLTKSFEHKDSDIEIKKPLSKLDYSLMYLYQTLGAASCILVTCFLNKDYNVLVSIFFCFTFAAFELILRTHLFKLMHKIDDFYLENLDVAKKNYLKFYEYFETYKKNLLVRPLNIVFTFTISMFLAFVVLFNSPYNFMIAIFPILLAIVERLFVTPWLEKKTTLLSNKEKSLGECQDSLDLALSIKDIHAYAYKVGKYTILKRSAYIVLMAVFSILTMYITNSVSLPNAIFFLCIEWMIYQNTYPALMLEEDLKKNYIEEVKIHNLINKK